MRLLLLSILAVAMIGLMVPSVYSDMQYNVKEGTTLNFTVDSSCETSISESGKNFYAEVYGENLEEILIDICYYKAGFMGFSGSSYWWTDVSSISTTVTESSADGTKFSDGRHGFNIVTTLTMKNQKIEEKRHFVEFGRTGTYGDWNKAIPTNVEVGDIIGDLALTSGKKIPVKIIDRKIMTIGGTPYVVLISSTSCEPRNDGQRIDCWKYFYDKETGIRFGMEETHTLMWPGLDQMKRGIAGQSTLLDILNDQPLPKKFQSTVTSSVSVMISDIPIETVEESTTKDLDFQTETGTIEQSKGGGCLIATAAFGSEMAPQVQFLRELRDNTVLQTQAGTTFMTGFNQFYYSFSPTVADYERENPMFKEAVKLTLIPLLTSLTLLNYVDIDTEQEMLGYGIGVILLNIGMYFVAPAAVIIAIKNRMKVAK